MRGSNVEITEVETGGRDSVSFADSRTEHRPDRGGVQATAQYGGQR